MDNINIISFYFHSSGATWGAAHINGASAGLSGQNVDYQVTSDDVHRGYVRFSASATVYLYSITLTHRLFRDYTLLTSTSSDFFGHASDNSVIYVDVDAEGNITKSTSPSTLYNGKFTLGHYNGDVHGYMNMVIMITL